MELCKTTGALKKTADYMMCFCPETKYIEICMSSSIKDRFPAVTFMKISGH